MNLPNKILYLILSFTFCLPITSYGQGWEIDAQVGRINDRNILEGYIDSTYKIKMVYSKHLNPYYCDDTNNIATQWLNRAISGWYSYESVGEKIPLIGSRNRADGYHHIRLYVPQNYTDTLTREKCMVDSFREVFYNNTWDDPTNMLWYLEGSHDTLPVNLTYIEKEGRKTFANLTLHFYGWPIKTIDLSKLSGLEYISEIWDLDYKEVYGEFFMTYKMTEPVWGNNFDVYLGFIHLDEDLNLVEYVQKDHIKQSLTIGEYDVIQGKPELGLVKKEE